VVPGLSEDDRAQPTPSADPLVTGGVRVPPQDPLRMIGEEFFDEAPPCGTCAVSPP
jgi:hypothetical protein